MSIELILPRIVAGDLRRLGTLERVSVGVVVEVTLDVKPLLELLVGLRIIDMVDEFVNPVFDLPRECN